MLLPPNINQIIKNKMSLRSRRKHHWVIKFTKQPKMAINHSAIIWQYLISIVKVLIWQKIQPRQVFTCGSALLSAVSLSMVSITCGQMVNGNPKHRVLLLMYPQKDIRAKHYITPPSHSPLFTSLHRHFINSYHHEGWVYHNNIFRQREREGLYSWNFYYSLWL